MEDRPEVITVSLLHSIQTGSEAHQAIYLIESFIVITTGVRNPNLASNKLVPKDISPGV
jgi:hypothetical protein